MCQHDFDYNHSAVHVCCVVTPSIMFAMMRLSSSSLCQFSLQYWCVYHFYHAHSPISVLFASPWVVLLNPMLLEVWYYSMMAIEMTNCFAWATMPISCVLIICYYTKTMTIYIYITMPSVVFRPIGHCATDTASGRSMFWMNPSYQDIFCAMPNQLDLVKGCHNSKCWWVLWHHHESCMILFASTAKTC